MAFQVDISAKYIKSMDQSTTLAEYVARRVNAGAPKSEIREELLAVGWSEEEADEAYRDGVVSIGAPVPSMGNRPTTGKKSSTVDIIINLFSFILLGIVATALGVLYFQIINRYLPDPLAAVSFYEQQSLVSVMHYSIAALLIGFPLYYLTMRIWFRKFRENEGRTESRLSKWLTYIVLLGTSVTIVGDLITLVFTFLQGELTGRFFLKAITILAIAAAVFGFYFFERRKIQYRRDVSARTFKSFSIAVAGVVAFGVVLGFFAGGSPEETRKLTFDNQRADDLRNLSGCVENYASRYGTLPSTLAELNRASDFTYCSRYEADPETKAPYEYMIITPSRQQGVVKIGEYELCATFATVGRTSPASVMNGVVDDVWSNHAAGRGCDIVSAQLGELAPTPAQNSGIPATALPSVVK
ncbi:MAG: hypothetical protein HGA31_06455 [Candidatus Moranbacteria bacterium]|nr:hypothetical protein [Candidatus Moranbacteria bacterium]